MRSKSLLGGLALLLTLCCAVPVSEAIAIRLHRARSWLRKADRAGESGDIDGQFIFLGLPTNLWVKDVQFTHRSQRSGGAAAPA